MSNIRNLFSQRSILYNLKPLGLDLGLIESLSSYLLRLSNIHNVEVGTLINKIIIPKLGQEYLVRSTEYGGNSFYERAKTMNSFNKNALSMVKLLGDLTGRNDLNHLTLLDLQGKFSNRNLLKSELSWCSQCLNEWKQEDGMYYPLIWQFRLVEVCIKHKQFLVNSCEACSKINPILRRNMRIGYCSYCENPLFKVSKLNPSEFNKEEWEWYKFCYRNILFILEGRLEVFNVVDFINEVFTQSFLGNLNLFSKFTLVPKSTLRGWIQGDNVPTLDGILKIFFILKIDFINLDIDFAKISFKELSIKKEPLVRKALNLKYIERELYRILEQQIPISMTVAADVIGRNKRLLYTHFPDLCKKVSKRYLNHRQAISKERIESIQQEVELTFWELKSKNIFPSRAAIEKKINKPGVLREPKIKDFWQKLIDREAIDEDE